MEAGFISSVALRNKRITLANLGFSARIMTFCIIGASFLQILSPSSFAALKIDRGDAV